MSGSQFNVSGSWESVYKLSHIFLESIPKSSIKIRFSRLTYFAKFRMSFAASFELFTIGYLPDVATIFRTVFNKEKSKLCPISIETITL